MNLNQIVALWACDGRAEQAFKQRQSFKGKRSGEVRLALSSDKREQAIELKAQGVKVSEIAKILSVHRDTVYTWINLSDEPKSDSSLVGV